MIKEIQGFEAYVLDNGVISATVVPALGARIISLRATRGGREWMWHPPGELNLFSNKPDDIFDQSPLAGWDECIPTIVPCMWRGRSLPDHGEVWAQPWHVDVAAWRAGILKTLIDLPVSPLRFERTLSLSGNSLIADYRITNLGAQEEEFQWAAHPLCPVLEGDRLDLTPETRRLLGNVSWPDTLVVSDRSPAYVKAYPGPLREGRAGIVNDLTGERLDFAWDTKENDTLGIWLTRGGWNGHHHVALEPTNCPADALTDNARHGHIAAGSTRSWHVTLSLGTGGS